MRDNQKKYKSEIKLLRKILNDNEYTRTLSLGYHQFLSNMHTKLISNSHLSQKMLDKIVTAQTYYDYYYNPDNKRKREAMLSKITKLKYLLTKCGYTRQYEYEKMEFLDSITKRVHSKGALTPKQAKYANALYKQFNKRILP